jgi:hypothetical protein
MMIVKRIEVLERATLKRHGFRDFYPERRMWAEKTDFKGDTQVVLRPARWQATAPANFGWRVTPSEHLP